MTDQDTQWRDASYPAKDVPRDVRVIVAWKEAPFEHLYLHAQVAILSSFDNDWRSAVTGEPIRKPTHWQSFMSLQEAIELGRTDNEANWDSPDRLEAYRIRTEARAAIPAPRPHGNRNPPALAPVELHSNEAV
jgi:hypothetical protein